MIEVTFPYLNARIKLLSNTSKVPERGSSLAAGYDLFSNEGATILPGQCKMIKTGISVTPPAGYFGAIFARSGMAAKRGLRPANCVGICDEDYTGEYIVALYNDSDIEQVVQVGDKIAQLVFLPYENITFEVVDNLEDTDRGAGGFGSTGQ